MTSNDPAADLEKGRMWLNTATRLFDTEHVDSNRAYTAAVIANGFVGLAHAGRSFEGMALATKVATSQLNAFQAIAEAAEESDEPTLGAAIERERQALAEARPHDDEPGQVFIVSDGPIQSWYAAESREKARAWADTRSSSDDLVVTTVAVDRG